MPNNLSLPTHSRNGQSKAHTINLGKELIASILRTGELQPALDAGLTLPWLTSREDLSRAAIFGDEDVRAYQYILKHHEKHGKVPHLDLFQKNFPAAAYRLPEDKGLTFAELAEEAGNKIRSSCAFELSAELLDLHDNGDYAEVDAAVQRYIERTAQRTGSRNTWHPMDISQWLNGDRKPVTPELGARDDGVFMLYPGRTHSVVAESEAGKSWLALFWCAQEIEAGHDVVYVDFEDSLPGILGRLILLASEDAIREHFRYIRPEEPIPSPRQFADSLAGASLAVLDGVTEAMSLHDLDPLSNGDIAKFNAMLANPISSRGPAVISLDHLVKDAKSQGRYALGGVHKLNAISGASFILKNAEPFGIGRTGRSGLFVAKDRPGQVRQHGSTASSGLIHVADMEVDSRDPEKGTELRLSDPGAFGEFRPTKLMARISKALQDAGGPLCKRDIEKLVKGNASAKLQAINILVKEGYADREIKGRTHWLTHVKLFTEDEQSEF